MEVEILIAEDEEGFRLIEKIALEKSKLNKSYTFLVNGEEVKAFFENLVAANKKLPEILILDLNMPLMNGWEVYDWMKTQPKLSDVRVVILSSSDNVSDIERAKSLNLEYQVKPINFDQYQDFFNSLAAQQ